MARRLLDRVFRMSAPSPRADFAPPPVELAPGLFALDRVLGLPGTLALPSRTVVVRLASGGLVVISAPPFPETAGPQLETLGRVEFVVAPNTFHYVYAAEFLRAFPGARFLMAPGLRERAPELPEGEVLGAEPPAAWAGELDYEIFGPVRGVSEAMFLHVPSGSLVLTDLAFHMVRIESWLQRLGWRLAGVPARFGPSRTARMLLLRGAESAWPSLARVAGWPLQRIVVAHGDVVEGDAGARFREAFAPYLGEA